MNKTRETIVRYGTYGLVCILPLLVFSHLLYPHISSKTFVLYGVVQILSALWLYTLITERSRRLSHSTMKQFLPLAAFLGWMTLAGILAVNPSLSLWSILARGTGLLTLYHGLVFALIVAWLAQTKGISYVHSLLQWFIAGAGIVSLGLWFGTEGFNIQYKALETGIGGGFAGNSTLAAGYLLFALAFGAFLLSVKTLERSKKRWIGAAMASIIFSPVFINVYGVLSGQSLLGSARGTLLAVVAGSIATGLGYLFLSRKKVWQRLSIASIAMGVIAFAVLWMQLITPNTALHQRFIEEARGSRFIFWDIAAVGMEKHPWFGYGPENYSIVFQENFNPKVLLAENSMEGWNDRAHNIYYELGVAGGYPAIIFYAILMLSIFYTIHALYKKSQLTRTQAAVLMGLFIAYLFNNLLTFDSVLSYTALFMTLGVLYGMRDMSQEKTTKAQARLHSGAHHYAIAGGLVVLCILSFVFTVFRPVQKAKAYAEVFASPINKRPEAYDRLYGGSRIGEDWDVGGLGYDVYRQYANNAAQVKADEKVMPYAAQDIIALLKYLEYVAQHTPTDYRLHISIVYLYNTLSYLTDKPYDPSFVEHIRTILGKAKALSPTNPNVYWSIAQVDVWGGDFKSAENAYRQAIALDPTLPASHRLFVQFAQAIGDKKLYEEALANAQESIPGFSLDKKI